ncbi:MAG: lipid A biosynthesis acyltransferase [Planctomycetes bacterium]|nr:lipid A biosynthesis acyltransferase [Planctomycetota bacterium]
MSAGRSDDAARRAADAVAPPAGAAGGATKTAAARGDTPPDGGWLSQRERGTLLGMRLAFGLAGLVGRRAMRPLVALVALRYALFDRAAKAASRDWLQRVHGREPSFVDVYRHVRTFTQVTLDRVFLLTGRLRGLAITRTGKEHLDRQLATGQGAVLLGAHLGSFEAMRAGGSLHGRPIRILGDFRNARMINALLERCNPGAAARVIHLGDDPVGVMASVKGRVEAGEFVAVLGDRVGPGTRAIEVDFLGAPARFPSGPFLLASLLRCPVYLVFGLYREPGSYEIVCEPFADVLAIPRGDREGALRAAVARYAAALERHARAVPDNWFNFFDFWSRP